VAGGGLAASQGKAHGGYKTRKLQQISRGTSIYLIIKPLTLTVFL